MPVGRQGSPDPAALRRFRARHRLTQAQAARLVTTALPTYRNWESEHRRERMAPIVWETLRARFGKLRSADEVLALRQSSSQTKEIQGYPLLG